MADLTAYLSRIGYEGPLRPDRATLDALHRAHALAVAYENLDVQLGRRRTPAPQAALDKIAGGRGGWCYEMNGSLGLALRMIGFDVTRMAGGVVRSLVGDGQVGNHLVLRVNLPEGPVIADVGFGDGPLTPFDLKDHAFSDRGFNYRLEDLGDGWWRLHNHPGGGAPDFDFRAEAADEALLAERCQFLQTSETSIFVQNVFCFRHNLAGYAVLRGRVLRHVTAQGVEEMLIASADDLVAQLHDVFGLAIPEAATLWDAVCARHQVVMAGATAS